MPRPPAGNPPAGPPNDGDDDLEIEGMFDPIAETPEQRAENLRRRAEIRSQYRDLIEEVQVRSHEPLTSENDGWIQTTIQRAERIFHEVKNPREAVMDSQLMAAMGNLARQRAQRFNANLVTFEPIEYAIKIMSFISDDQQLQEDAAISVQGWEKLGEAVQPFFKRTPPLQLMYGSFRREPPEVKAPKAPRPKDVLDANAKKTVPEQLKSFKDADKANEEATTEQVEKILENLKKYCYEQNNGDPLCYFEFVINPESFTQTVENMFYVSFLINDGLARIILDADNLPLIAPTNPEVEGDGQRNGTGDSRKKQVVMTLTKKDWEDIIRVCGITEPLLPTREYHNEY